MEKIVKVPVFGDVEILDAPEDFDYKWLAKQIGCDWIEVVRPRDRLAEGLIMIVDEEGLLKENVINIAGSWLYGTDLHGQPIVGDMLIIKEVYGDDGPEFASMSEETAESLKEDLGDKAHLFGWAEQIFAGIGRHD